MTVITCALTPAKVDPEARTITGTATFFGQRANASTGAVIFEPGSLSLPEDLSRVKLCIEHDHHSAVGYAVAADDEGDRLTMRFFVPETPAGDEALASAANGLRDGLSVGAYPEPGGWQYVNGEETTHITRATVREVSLTAIPAFPDARVTNVAAAALDPDTEKETPMENSTPTTETLTTETTGTEAPTVEAATPQAPPILPASATPITVRAAAETAARLITDSAPAAEVRAALKDILPSADKGTGFLGRPSWLGELWTGRRVDRPLIDSITSKPLGRTTKVKGWRWKTRPTVDTYAGNKTEIPSSTMETEAIEATVNRIAGGWDIDRIYVDLGDPDLIEAMWSAAVEDYALKTEAAVATALVAAATDINVSNTLPAALVSLGKEAAGHGSSLSFVAFGVDVWAAFTALKRDEVPWWLGGGDAVNLSTTTATVNGLRLFVDPSLAAGTILAGDKRAATYYEDGTPIRINAIDLPKGGIDLGLFGYYGLLVNDERALFKIDAEG